MIMCYMTKNKVCLCVNSATITSVWNDGHFYTGGNYK